MIKKVLPKPTNYIPLTATTALTNEESFKTPLLNSKTNYLSKNVNKGDILLIILSKKV